MSFQAPGVAGSLAQDNEFLHQMQLVSLKRR